MSAKSYSGLLVSQIGYDAADDVRAIVRGAEHIAGPGTYRLTRSDGSQAARGELGGAVRLWDSWWRIADLGRLKQGTYALIVQAGGTTFGPEPLEVGDDLLWHRTWQAVSYDQAERRAKLATNRVGWQDCGASWQEANSHAAYIIGMAELLLHARGRIGPEQRERIERQVINGCDYLAKLQDRAAELGRGDGALVHQMPRFEEFVLPGDVNKAVVAFALAARALSPAHVDRSHAYIDRAERAFNWLRTARPFGPEGFSRIAHGAPEGFVPPPDQWMTRDLLMMIWGALALSQCDRPRYQADAVALAEQVMHRQVRADEAEDGLHGHFRTYDGVRFAEKAWIHHLEKNVMNGDAGGHYPNWVLPLLRMRQTWPQHPRAAAWEAAVHDFAYGYLLPACQRSPFLIAPLGIFAGEGLLHFAGLWHGMNCVYPLTAALALEFERFFHEPAFRPVAVGNLQWIAGLNAGITRDSMFASVMFSMDVPEGAALPVSMINGIGRRCAGTWLNVRGAICNGFATGEQFRFDVEPRRDLDGPHSFTDEDWITHAGAWLSAIVRL